MTDEKELASVAPLRLRARKEDGVRGCRGAESVTVTRRAGQFYFQHKYQVYYQQKRWAARGRFRFCTLLHLFMALLRFRRGLVHLQNHDRNVQWFWFTHFFLRYYDC